MRRSRLLTTSFYYLDRPAAEPPLSLSPHQPRQRGITTKTTLATRTTKRTLKITNRHCNFSIFVGMVAFYSFCLRFNFLASSNNTGGWDEKGGGGNAGLQQPEHHGRMMIRPHGMLQEGRVRQKTSLQGAVPDRMMPTKSSANNKKKHHHQQEEEFIMWNKDKAIFHECRAHFLHNDTWGKPRTKFVDKVAVKELVLGMKTSVKVFTTLATYNNATVANFTPQAMQSLAAGRNNYVIKGAHTSGGVARVVDGMYDCYKNCIHAVKKATGGQPLAVVDNPKAAKVARMQMQFHLNRDYSKAWGELQYQRVPRAILIEEHPPLESSIQPMEFFVVNGVVVFAKVPCRGRDNNNNSTTSRQQFLYVSANFRKLPIRVLMPGGPEQTAGSCLDSKKTRPKVWTKMVEIATKMSQHVPGFVRIDLYADDAQGQVYFSEFAFNPLACDLDLLPRVVEGLIYAVQYDGEISSSPHDAVVTADFVERTILDQSWVLVVRVVETSEGGARGGDGGGDGSASWLPFAAATGYPSPVDLCWHLVGNHHRHQNYTVPSSYRNCIAATRSAAARQSPLRCVISEKDGGETSYQSIGVTLVPALDWQLGSAILAVIAMVTLFRVVVTNKKKKKKKHHQPNLHRQEWRVVCVGNCLFVGLLALVEFARTNNEAFFFSLHLLSGTAVTQIYDTFTATHFIKGSDGGTPWVALCLVATMWIRIAPWQAKSLQNMLWWHLIGIMVLVPWNEFVYNLTMPNEMRCIRMAVLLNSSPNKHYIVNNLFVQYMLEPLFTYWYLIRQAASYVLPSVEMEWFGSWNSG